MRIFIFLFISPIFIFGGIGLGESNTGALPVEITTFAATLNDGSISLVWKTASEVNNYGFEIERSFILTPTSRWKNLNEVGGTSTSLSASWETLGFINGSGNSNSLKEYSFIDEKIKDNGKYSYRLKQIDIDGSYSYSNIIEVTCNLQLSAFELFQNYPNPFNPVTIISYTLPVSSNVTIKVYDILGNEISTPVNARHEPGSFNIYFNASGLSTGIYIYKIHAGDFIDAKKMIVIK